MRTLSRVFVASVVCSLTPAVGAGVPALAADAGSRPAPPPAAASPDAGEPDRRYIVTFAPGTDVASGVRALRGQGARVDQPLSHVFPGAVATMPAQAAAGLARNPHVTAVVADREIHLAGSQSPAPWGLDRLDQRGLPLDGALTYRATGAGVTAYVFDTGIRPTHVDFGGRVRPGYTAIKDGGGTGDCHGHGTHVAGTLGGARHGVAKNVSLVPVRVLGCTGSGSYSGIIGGLDWMIGKHTPGTLAVANLSLTGPADATLDSAVDAAVDHGITVVVAAGNASADACATSPARSPKAVTVGASDSTDTRASFSNYGTCLDVFAPGAKVVSASNGSDTGTTSMSGTSMAAPHVAGAAAVLLESSPSASPAQVADRLTDTATRGVVGNRGTGSPDLLLWADPTIASPTDPSTRTPTASPETTLTAGPAADSFTPRRSAVFRYTSESASEFVCTLDGAPLPCTGSSVKVGGLSAGSHEFSVAAVASDGSTDASPVRRTWTVPRNNRVLRHGTGWSKRQAAGRYLNTFSATTRHRATLSTRVSAAHGLALVVTRAPMHGRVAVYVGTTLVKRVGLASSTVRSRRVVPLGRFSSPVTGRVRVVTISSGRPVHIEGLGVATR